MALAIRQLSLDDWKACRELRLFGLRSDPGMFFAPYDRELALPDSEWQRRVSDPSQAMFGLFDGNKLVGITGVVTDRADPAGATALLVASFILPEYRGRGHSAKFYEARLAWVQAKPHYTRVLVSHRKSNEPSGRANQRFGFVETLRRPLTWPDGEVDDEVCYELRITRDVP